MAGPVHVDLDDVDCVDLTLSPSPEPQPRRRVLQQPISTYLKQEKRDMPSVKTKHSLPSSSTQAAASECVAPHLLQVLEIINTSDLDAIRTVLWNLCKLSPALSGAVARGLAPHSTFARATIKEYRKKAAASHVKSDSAPVSKSLLEKRKKVKPVTSLPGASIKREPGAVSISSDDDDDDDDDDGKEDFVTKGIPRSSTNSRPRSTEPSSSKLRDRDAANASRITPDPDSSRLLSLLARDVARSSSAKSSRTLTPFPDRSKQSSIIKTAPATTSRKCKRCHQTFADDEEECLYHPGRKRMSTDDYGNREAVFGCCWEPITEVGCTTGKHVAEAEKNVNQHRRGPAWSPTLAHGPKKPRLL